MLATFAWVIVGPWDLSTVTVDGHRVDDVTGMVRVYAVLAIVDVATLVGSSRRWLEPGVTTVYAGITWTILAFGVSATSRVTGANMAGVWLVFGPVMTVANSLAVVIVTQIALAVRRRWR